ncbi:hypothetical protein V2J09_022954 [Rumex salicifolius]
MGREMGRQVLVMETQAVHPRNGVVLPWPCSRSSAAEAQLRQGITVLMRRWTGLQMALQNEWGGRDSRQKYDLLIADLLSWLSQSKGPLCLEELENFLHESMLLSFNTEMEDGSIDLVAEHLMMMHEDYLHGCYA